MKPMLTILFLSLFNIMASYAQNSFPEPIEPFYLPVGANKTTVLILPSTIKNVDRGNGILITRTVKEMDNVLKIKFGADSNITTNLHVFTADRKVYNFITFYDSDPTECTWNFAAASPTSKTPSFNYYFPSSKNIGGIKLKPTGLFIEDGIIYVRFKIKNRSAIPFNIHFVRFNIKDNKTARRTSITEKELNPLDGYPLIPESIPANNQQEFTISFEQFTIASKKHLSVQVFEKNGDRNITCKIFGRRLLKAKPFNNKIHKICKNP